jgi:hypothetical protein
MKPKPQGKTKRRETVYIVLSYSVLFSCWQAQCWPNQRIAKAGLRFADKPSFLIPFRVPVRKGRK